MGEFVASPGYENCPKCGGWQVLDKTIRQKNGWPIGPVVMEACDHCAGAGQIKLPEVVPPITIRDNSGLVKASGWGAKPLEPGPVKFDPPGAPVEPVAAGWAVFDKDKA